MTTIEASINERHLKDFIRLLQCAAKFGDELCISANKDLWEMAVTNSTKSAYCLFKLQPEFFSRYKLRGSLPAQRKGVKCQLLAKLLLAVLGKTSATNTIQRLDLTIYDPHEQLRSKRRKEGVNGSHDSSAEDNRSRGQMYVDERDAEEHEGGRESKLVVRLICKHGVTKKHSLYLAFSEFLRAEVDPNTTTSGFTIPARTLRDWLDHFSLSTGPAAAGTAGLKADNQLGWLFTKDEVRIKSWEGTSKGLCTEMKLEAAEFGVDAEGEERYHLEDDRVDLTLPMKEFNAALQLADALTIDLSIAFSEAGQPLTLTYNGGNDDDFDIFCAIATTGGSGFDPPPPPPPGGDRDRNREAAGAGGRTSRAPSASNGNVNANLNQSRFKAGIEGGQKRRTDSDLTDVYSAPAAGPSRGANGTGARQRSETPMRRKQSRLDLTPGQNNNAGGSQTSRPRISAMPSGSHGAAHESESEPLFLPGGSQEDAAHGAVTASQAGRALTQQEVLEISGLGDMTEEDLGNALDDMEEEEWRESQIVRQSRTQAAEDEDEDMDALAAQAEADAEDGRRAKSKSKSKATEKDKEKDEDTRAAWFLADHSIFDGGADAGTTTRTDATKAGGDGRHARDVQEDAGPSRRTSHTHARKPSRANPGGGAGPVSNTPARAGNSTGTSTHARTSAFAPRQDSSPDRDSLYSKHRHALDEAGTKSRSDSRSGSKSRSNSRSRSPTKRDGGTTNPAPAGRAKVQDPIPKANPTSNQEDDEMGVGAAHEDDEDEGDDEDGDPSMGSTQALQASASQTGPGRRGGSGYGYGYGYGSGSGSRAGSGRSFEALFDD